MQITTGSQFPFSDDKERLRTYETYEMLLESNHLKAFSIKAPEEVSRDYQHLRYIAINFCGLVSRVFADMLFGEPLQLKTKDPVNTQWLEAVWKQSHMDTKAYENSLSNSAMGDAVIRVRVIDKNITIENLEPEYYFPDLDTLVDGKPTTERIIWKGECKEGDTKKNYVYIETHTPGTIDFEIYELLQGDKLGAKQDLNVYNTNHGTAYIESAKTGVKTNLIFHIPNYKDNLGYFGTSDYRDIESLVFALNNRFTKIDNILDKHSDPILAVPDGVLDERGNVTVQASRMIQMSESGGKPEYIVWNANLDNAFKEIELLVQYMMMMTETSMDVFGLGSGGQAESGRALKLRLLRTIAKVNRKRLYYNQALTELLQVLQELAIANKYTVDGLSITKAEEVELIWSDGLVNDVVELIEAETLKLEAGITSKKRAVMAVEGVSDAEADKVLVEIETEQSKSSDFNAFKGNPFASRDQSIDNANTTSSQQPSPEQTRTLVQTGNPENNSGN